MPVQHGLTSIATGSRTKTATLTSVGSTSNAFPLLNYKMSGSSVTTTDPDEYSADGYMASATSLEVERAKAGSPNLDFSWQIVRTDANTGKTAHDRATVPTSVSGSYTYAENTIPGTWDLDQTSISPAIMQGIGRISGSYSDADERRAAPHLGILLSQSGSTTSLTYRAGDTSAVTWPQPRSPRASVVDWGPSTASSPPITVTEAEQVGVADSATVSLAKTETDQVGVADASASQAALVPADTVSVTDASASQAALAPADTVSVADASASQAALAPAADTASITDQQASGVSLQENDSASVTDSSTISQSGSQQLTLSDAVSASDSTSASVQKAAQDSITIAEDEAVAANWYRITQDRVDLTEVQSSSIEKREQDSVGAADDRAVTISLIVSDSVLVLDQAIQNPFRLQESIGVSDSVSIVTQISGIDSVTIRGRTSTVGLSGRSGSISLRGLSGTTQIKGRSLR
jgi:epidermal growth factor receptor substrate 15